MFLIVFSVQKRPILTLLKSYSAKGASFLFSIEYSLSQESYFTFATLLLGLGLVFLSGREVGFRYLSGGAKKKNSRTVNSGLEFYKYWREASHLPLSLFSIYLDAGKVIPNTIL